jgi:dCTP deaminase
MSLLSYTELCHLIDSGVIRNSRHEHVNATSIDLVLGNKLLIEREEPMVIGEEYSCVTVDMLDKNPDSYDTFIMNGGGYTIPPGGCVLAHTVEEFHLPNWISAEYKLKSTQARNFLDHLNAGWADAGWHGSVLTLEFVNHNRFHNIRIRPGMKCGQMVFFKHEEVPSEASYANRGQYNHDKTVTHGKGLK